MSAGRFGEFVVQRVDVEQWVRCGKGRVAGLDDGSSVCRSVEQKRRCSTQKHAPRRVEDDQTVDGHVGGELLLLRQSVGSTKIY